MTPSVLKIMGMGGREWGGVEKGKGPGLKAVVEGEVVVEGKGEGEREG